LITRLRKNTKDKPADMTGRLLLRRRAAIEPANAALKNICQAEHNRHRGPVNFPVNLLAGLLVPSVPEPESEAPIVR
jgi:hypothetical protein